MALLDIDPNSHDRSSPLPQGHDLINPSMVLAKGTNSVNYVSAATDLAAVNQAKNGQFTIVQVGNFTTASAYSTTNPGAGNYAIDTFHIYLAPHNLNFIPTILAYELSSAGQYTPMPLVGYATNGGATAVWYTYTIDVNATNVEILLTTMTLGNISATFAAGFIFKWYLMYQTSN